MNNEKKSKEKEDIVKDDIIHDYDSVLKESGVLTSVSGIIFGFLLNISINSPKGFTIEDSILLMISLYSISFAVSFFCNAYNLSSYSISIQRYWKVQDQIS